MNKINLWRYALLGILLTCLSYSAQGQVTLKYDTTLIKKISNDVCECYQNAEILDTQLTSSPLVMDECANTKILKYLKELNLFTDLSEEELDSEQVRYKISNSIGTRLIPFLYRDCPNFIKLMKERESRAKKAYAETEYTEEEVTEEAAEYETEEEYFVLGKIKEIQQIDNLTFVLLENEAGEIRQLLWLNRFYGDELLINDLEATKKEKVHIEFIEVEQLNPRTKKMQTFQRINWIKLVD